MLLSFRYNMSLLSFLERIVAIQTKLDDFFDLKNGEVLEIDIRRERFIKRKACEYLGLDIPRTMLCFNSKGRIAMCKPSCPYCDSYNIYENGWKFRKPKVVTGQKIELIVQKYKCVSCNKPFPTPLDDLLNTYEQFTRDVVSLALHLNMNCQLSYKTTAETIRELTGISMSHETVRRWAEKPSKLDFEVETCHESHGVYHMDEQKVTISGKGKWRYAIIEDTGQVIKDEIRDNREQDTIAKFMINALANKKVHAIVTDMDNKYPGAIEELRKAIHEEQKIPLKNVKIIHQLCIFHLFQHIIRELKKASGWNPFARKKLPEDLDQLRKDLQAVFFHKTWKGARDAFDKIFECRWDYNNKKVRSLIENIDKNFNDLTWFMKDLNIPKTNNVMENYFRTTHPEKVKSKFRTVKGLETQLTAMALKKSIGSAWLGIVGLSVSVFDIVGKIAQFMAD